MISNSDYDIEQMPWHFGVFLNMARQNMILISEEIGCKFGITTNKNSKKGIVNSFLTNRTSFENYGATRLFGGIAKFIPAAKALSCRLQPKSTAADIEKTILFLQLAIPTLDRFRNSFTHCYTITNENENTLETVTKDKTTDIDPKLASLLQQLLSAAIAQTKARFAETFSDDDFRFVKLIAANRFINENNELRTLGLVFFCNLFLDRDNALRLTDSVRGSKATKQSECVAMREVFVAFSAKLPADDNCVKLQSPIMMQLNMLKHISRIPTELYNHLSPENKKKVIPKPVNEGKTDNQSCNDYAQQIYNLKRTSDNFASFAIKYLDESTSFKQDFQINLGTLKTKRYRKIFSDEDAAENNRWITQGIIIHGPMSKYLAEKNNVDIDQIAFTEKMMREPFDGVVASNPVRPTPRYNIAYNRVGMLSIPDELPEHISRLPISVYMSINEMHKVVLLELLKKGSASRMISNFVKHNNNGFFMEDVVDKIRNSLNLRYPTNGFTFDRHLSLVSKNAWRNKRHIIPQTIRISQQYADCAAGLKLKKERLAEILDKYTLSIDSVPTRIISYWLNTSFDNKKTVFKNMIKAERRDCLRRHAEIKKGIVPKPEIIVSFIVRDIAKTIISLEVLDKLKALGYGKLKELLLKCGDAEGKAPLIDTCQNKLGLFDKKKGHPFLSDISFRNVASIEDLYATYIELKGAKTTNVKEYDRRREVFIDKIVGKDWLYRTFYISKKMPDNTTIIEIDMPLNQAEIPIYYRNAFLEEEKIRSWLYATDRSEGFMKPINLPLKLFDALLVEELSRAVADKIKTGEKFYFSKLLALWSESTQNFYGMEREYSLFAGRPYQQIIKVYPNEGRRFFEYYSHLIPQVLNMRHGANVTNAAAKEYEITRTFKKTIDENEKIIRYHQAKDRILWLMLEDMLGSKIEASLTDMEQGNINNLLEKPKKIAETIIYRTNGDRKQKTITGTRKLKDLHSELCKITCDRRVPNMLDYYADRTVTFDIIKSELDDHDRYSTMVLNAAFDLEEVIIVKLTATDGLSKFLQKASDSGMNHDLYLNLLLQDNDTLKSFLTEIRRSFLNGQFPTKASIAPYITVVADGKSSVASQLANKYVEAINSLIKSIINTEADSTCFPLQNSLD